MSCVREASLEPPYQTQAEQRNGESRKGRFLRGLRRMFRRRNSSRSDRSPDTSKSRSTSELLTTDNRRKESAYGSGLSVSHDSIFTGERSGDDSAEDTSHRQKRNPPHRAELVAAVRRRARADEGSDDDEDLGLPRSPPASPPTDKTDKRQNTGISASSCSDGSLLSVESSEMEEDSSSGHATVPRHELRHTDAYTWYEPPSGVAPLSHSAARHKMAVRPRRTHGAPRRKQNNQPAAVVLPVTPELNEENARSATPDVNVKNVGETATYYMKISSESITTKESERKEVVSSDSKAKSSSLPPGLALSKMLNAPKMSVAEDYTPRSSIKRSESNSHEKVIKDKIIYSSADHNILDDYNYVGVHERKNDIENVKAPIKENFFSRLLLRRSGKKKKESMDSESGNNTLEKPHSQYKSVERDYLDEVYMQTTHHITVESSSHAAGQPYANNLKKHENEHLENVKAHVVKGSCIQKNLCTNVLMEKVENFNLKYEKDPFLDHGKRHEQVSKTLITKETNKSQDIFFQSKIKEDPITPDIKFRRIPPPDYSFHSGSMPKRIPYFNKNLHISSSVSPPKTTFNEFSPQFNSVYDLDKNLQLSPKQEAISKSDLKFFKNAEVLKQASESNLSERNKKTAEDTEMKNSIGKSQSFRYPTENVSINWHHEKDLPSLPAIVGISNAQIDVWNSNGCQKPNNSFLDCDSNEKRVSARNYHIFNRSSENNFDSLQSTDCSYLDSLRSDVTSTHEIDSIFSNGIKNNNKIIDDISQIEAKIDNIIGSKQIPNCIAKSSSLDSVKSVSEKCLEDKKSIDERRKTISVEVDNSFNTNSKSLTKDCLTKSENYITVTHLNNEKEIAKVTVKISKSDERLQKNPNVPEFLQIQLNKVETNPLSNVVLTANSAVKKCTNKEKDNENEICSQVFERKSPIVYKKSVSQTTNDKSDSNKLSNNLKSKSLSGESLTSKSNKSRSKSLSENTGDTNEKMDRKSLLSFGSKSSLQSADSNESTKTPDRIDEPVVFRRKTGKSNSSKDDEPELLKVFARRSLKIKDCEELFEAAKEEAIDIEKSDNKTNVSHNVIENNKKEAKEDNTISVYDRVVEYKKKDTSKYKKEIADTTPEKRMRNRTFPDPLSPTDSERKLPIRNFSFASTEVKDVLKVFQVGKTMCLKNENNVGKNKVNSKNDLDNHDLNKVEVKFNKVDQILDVKKSKVDDVKVKNDSKCDKLEIVADKKVAKQSEKSPERISPEREVDDEEFRGILHVREQWERRAQQAKAK